MLPMLMYRLPGRSEDRVGTEAGAALTRRANPLELCDRLLLQGPSVNQEDSDGRKDGGVNGAFAEWSLKRRFF